MAAAVALRRAAAAGRAAQACNGGQIAIKGAQDKVPEAAMPPLPVKPGAPGGYLPAVPGRVVLLPKQAFRGSAALIK